MYFSFFISSFDFILGKWMPNEKVKHLLIWNECFLLISPSHFSSSLLTKCNLKRNSIRPFLNECASGFAFRRLAEAHDKQYRSVPFGEELIKEMVMASVFSLPLSQNSAMTAYKLMIQRVTKVAQVRGNPVGATYSHM